MSYGLKVRNTSGNVIISDATINPIYRGKATYVSQQAPGETFSSGELEYGFYKYRLKFRIAVSEQIFPFVTANDGCEFVLYTIVPGTGGDAGYQVIYVYSELAFSSSGMKVYCFSTIPDGTTAEDAGLYGLNIYGPAPENKLRFSSTLNNLAPVAARSITTNAISFVGGYSGYFLKSPNEGINTPYSVSTATDASYATSSGYTFSGRPAIFFTASRVAAAQFIWRYWKGSHFENGRIEDLYMYYTQIVGGNFIQGWRKTYAYEAEDDRGSYILDASYSTFRAAQSDFILVIDTAHYD